MCLAGTLGPRLDLNRGMDDMSNPRLETRRAACIATLLACGLLQACSSQQPITSGARVYAVDVTGQAKTCEVAKLNPADGQTIDTTMKVDGNGGWCGLPLHQSEGKPFDAGLLVGRPSHGTVIIHEVGDATRVDYTPDKGYSGTDSFAVKLIPGDAVIRISVEVTKPGA
jgi:hypothetical protein